MKEQRQTPPNEFPHQRINALQTWITQGFEAWSAPLPGMLLLTGPAACGTTTLLSAWIERHPQRSPYDPTEDEDDLFPLPSARGSGPSVPRPITPRMFTAIHRETPMQCARRLCEIAGSPTSARRADEGWRAAAFALRPSDLLIIDQAERLSLTLLQCLQGYLFEPRVCSLLLVGTPALCTTLERDPSLVSRVLAATTFEDLSHHDPGVILPAITAKAQSAPSLSLDLPCASCMLLTRPRLPDFQDRCRKRSNHGDMWGIYGNSRRMLGTVAGCVGNRHIYPSPCLLYLRLLHFSQQEHTGDCYDDRNIHPPDACRTRWLVRHSCQGWRRGNSGGRCP